MTLKYWHLVSFAAGLLEQGYAKIGDTSLRQEIGKRFGVSPYVQRHTMDALKMYGLITAEVSLDPKTAVWSISVPDNAGAAKTQPPETEKEKNEKNKRPQKRQKTDDLRVGDGIDSQRDGHRGDDKAGARPQA